MSRMFGFLSILIVVATGAFIYSRQAQNATPAGATSPLARVETTAIKKDLLNIAQAERSHNALHGGYTSLDGLRSAGELSLATDNRGPYNYTVDVSESSFHIVATYTGSDPGMPKSISIDQTMQITQE